MRKRGAEPKSFRLSKTTLRRLEQLSEKLEISKTDVVELAVRRLARSERRKDNYGSDDEA